MMLPVLFQQLVWNGIVSGSLIASSALGLTLLFGVLNFINVAYAEYMTLGGYLLFSLTGVNLDTPLLFALVVTVVVVALVALLTDLVIFRHFREQPIVALIASLGLAIILRSGVRIMWGSSGRLYQGETGETVSYLGVRIIPIQVAIVVVTVLLVGVVYLFLHRTKVGIGMRAYASNANLARLRGISVDWLVVYVWLISGALAATSGLMLAIDSQLTPLMGIHHLIPTFAAVFIGGVGNPRGAIVGGFAIGLSQELSTGVLPSEYKPAIGLLILVVVLLLKPEGVFGEAKR